MTVPADPTASGARRRGRWVVLAVVVLVVLVALTTWLVRRGGSTPSTPQAAARSWADDVLQHHTDDAVAEQCRPEVHTDLDVIGLTAGSINGVRALSATKDGAESWRVELQTLPASSGSTFAVTVVRRDGTYLVCD